MTLRCVYEFILCSYSGYLWRYGIFLVKCTMVENCAGGQDLPDDVSWYTDSTGTISLDHLFPVRGIRLQPNCGMVWL